MFEKLIAPAFEDRLECIFIGEASGEINRVDGNWVVSRGMESEGEYKQTDVQISRGLRSALISNNLLVPLDDRAFYLSFIGEITALEIFEWLAPIEAKWGQLDQIFANGQLIRGPQQEQLENAPAVQNQIWQHEDLPLELLIYLASQSNKEPVKSWAAAVSVSKNEYLKSLLSHGVSNLTALLESEQAEDWLLELDLGQIVVGCGGVSFGSVASAGQFSSAVDMHYVVPVATTASLCFSISDYDVQSIYMIEGAPLAHACLRFLEACHFEAKAALVFPPDHELASYQEEALEYLQEICWLSASNKILVELKTLLTEVPIYKRARQVMHDSSDPDNSAFWIAIINASEAEDLTEFTRLDFTPTDIPNTGN